MDPLAPFAHWRRPAPYLAEPPECRWRAKVVAVRPKTPWVAARRGGIAHLNDGVAAVFYDNSARFGARFLCGGGSKDIAVLPSPDAYGGVCTRCADIAEGPCVYRCFSASGELLYIGSTGSRLGRLQSHETQTMWWPDVAEVKIERFPTIFEARAAERLAIIAEAPLHNTQYRRPA